LVLILFGTVSALRNIHDTNQSKYQCTIIRLVGRGILDLDLT